ncbi:hypothetical protein PY254_08470 [Rhodanobacter sp. AS-Z3]|uniref:hypothetical protein n=1 Tax=Rhodanobacter sp. AS-Z3 TaxID=3031330 RepID=UPI0024796981|nr:hypothetical protein [Rhodanobacter sp. AS-Z3]WEN16687.1 hypothetical protein PY254_08470 [Rhodanobacter sp. AS-Z3]
MSRRLIELLAILGVAVAAIAVTTVTVAAQSSPPVDSQKTALASEVAALKAQVAQLQLQHPAPELGQQMLQLQIRHDRLWWAGQSGNWTMAYFMVGELGEALRGIEQTNGDAPELQPEKLSELMPSIMNPAIKEVQEALATQDKAAFSKAYDKLSAACTACHQAAGNTFLIMQRPQTPLLDNLRYDPVAQ